MGQRCPRRVAGAKPWDPRGGGHRSARAPMADLLASCLGWAGQLRGPKSQSEGFMLVGPEGSEVPLQIRHPRDRSDFVLSGHGNSSGNERGRWWPGEWPICGVGVGGVWVTDSGGPSTPPPMSHHLPSGATWPPHCLSAPATFQTLHPPCLTLL